jgi:hypothetical protein
MKKSLILLGVAAAILVAVSLLQKKEPACIRLQAKVDLAKEFCDGMAIKLAEDKCSSLAEDAETMGQCLRVLIPAAHSACQSYISHRELIQQYESLCQ